MDTKQLKPMATLAEHQASNAVPHTVVLYHAKCMDGFASAFAHCHLTGSNELWTNTDYVPMNYGDPLPYHLFDKDTKVIFLDFSASASQIVQLCATVNSVLIIDHHQAAMTEILSLSPIENLILVFNNDYSGCVLTWNYFSSKLNLQNQDIPKFLLHIQDRDLWKFLMPDTRAFHAKASTMAREYEVWQDLLQEDNVREIIAVGKDILSFQDDLVEKIADRMDICSIYHHTTFVINCPPELVSETGDFIIKKYPKLDFVLLYFIWDSKVKCSLRGRGTVDCAELASKFGGGGHKNAAGFSLTLQEFVDIVS